MWGDASQPPGWFAVAPRRRIATLFLFGRFVGGGEVAGFIWDKGCVSPEEIRTGKVRVFDDIV